MFPSISNMNQESVVLGTELIVSFLIVVLSLFVRPVRHKLLKIILKELSQAKGNKVISRDDNKIHRDVYQEIVGLRYKVVADRVEVFQFENGSRFSLSNPTWKITETYEVIKDGLRYFADDMHRIQISHLIDIILPVFGAVEQIKGVSLKNVGDVNGNKKVIVSCYNELNNSRYKYELLKRGVKTAVVVPLKDKSGDVFGMISVGYAYEKKIDEAELVDIVTASDNIQTYLNSLFNGR